MTREEEIRKAALNYVNGIIFSSPSDVIHFENGAKWADKNPVNLGKETRGWGEFFVLDEFPTTKVKRLVIKKDKNISYQYHNNRSEFWSIAQGEGYLILDGVLTRVSAGDTVFIEKNVKHSIKAINGDLVILEVQYGTECNEDDIVRITRNFDSIKTN